MKTLIQSCLLISLMNVAISTASNAQTKFFNRFDVNAGLSITDGSNFGVRYHFKQNAFGINVGAMSPGNSFFQLLSSVSYQRHLLGTSKHTDVMPWYIKCAVHHNYSQPERSNGDYSATDIIGVRLYLGRDFNLSPRFGVSAAVGPYAIVYDEFSAGTREPRALAGMDLTAFYRFK